jgi:uncharacterized membrane protein HdeD (DUF308 family)
VLFGVVTLGVGLFFVGSLHETLSTFTVIAGVFLLGDGVLAIFGSIFGKGEGRGLLALIGVLSAIAGLVLIKKAFDTLVAFTLILGIWFVVTGVVRFVVALAAPEGRGRNIVTAILDVIAGIVILSWPGVGLSTLAVIIGVVLIVRGVRTADSQLLPHKHATDPARSAPRDQSARCADLEQEHRLTCFPQDGSAPPTSGCAARASGATWPRKIAGGRARRSRALELHSRGTGSRSGPQLRHGSHSRANCLRRRDVRGRARTRCGPDVPPRRRASRPSGRQRRPEARTRARRAGPRTRPGT